MGLLKKLKKIHNKTIAHKLVTKVDPLGKKLFGKKKKGGNSTPAAEMKPASAKTSLAPRPALAKQVAASQAAAAAKKPPLQTGGPGQKTPIGSSMTTGGGAQRSTVPVMRQNVMDAKRRMLGAGLRPPTGGVSKPMSPAGVNLNRIAKGYNNR